MQPVVNGETAPLDGPIDSGSTPDRREMALAEAAVAYEEGDWKELSGVFTRYADLRQELELLLGLEARYGISPSFDPLSVIEAGPPTGRRYQLLGLLGEGTYGMVFRARDRELGRLVALKVFKKPLSEVAALTRFLDEPQVASQLDHPGIPAVYAWGKMADGKPYVAMRLIDGQTLRDRMDVGPPLPELLGVFRGVCQSIAYAHSRGVVHRDLKPANVMVGRFGEVMVLDWGLNRVLLAGDEPPRTLRHGPGAVPAVLTQSGAWVGTPSYMPPEQARTKGQVDTSSDVFGLGAVLCEILTGLPPYAAEDGCGILKAIETGDLSNAWRRLDACAADLVLVGLAKRCLAADPKARPDAAGVAAVVEKHLADLQERVIKEKAEASRARAWAAFTAVTSLFAVAAVVWYSVEVRRSAKEQARLAGEEAKATARREEAAGLLGQTEGALRAGDPNAAGPLLRANGRLAEGGDADQRDRAKLLGRCLAFLKECDAIGHRLDGEGRYEGAFERLGLPLPSRDGESRFLQAVAELPVRNRVVSALDHWQLMEHVPGERRRLLRLAREAAGGDGDSDWGKRFRSEEARASPTALASLAAVTLPDQRSPVELMVLARALIGVKRNADASDLLRRGLARYPRHAGLHVALAASLGPTGLPEAIEHARVALALRSESVEIRDGLAALLTRSGRDTEAADHLRRAAADKPTPDRYCRLIDALLRAGDRGGAERACREAISVFPQDSRFADRLQVIQGRLADRSEPG